MSATAGLGGIHKITDQCTNCEACFPLCPVECIFYGSRHYVIDADTCIGCGVCERVCPVSAIYDPDELARQETEAKSQK